MLWLVLPLLLLILGAMIFAARSRHQESTEVSESRSANLLPDNVELRKCVDALSEESFGTMDLGTPAPFQNENVTYIISQRKKAIPLLVNALKDGDCVKVGYAAYCLMLMKASEGSTIARQKLAELHTSDDISYKRYFAMNCLEDYLALK